MKEIFLNHSKIALVDDSDFDFLSQWKWRYDSKGYASRWESHKIVRMHRLIMGNPEGKLIDHINMDKLDNRRENLRVCTNSENLYNRPKNKNNTSGYKGVTWFKRDSKWRAAIMIDRKMNHLGYFEDVVEAAKAYDIAANMYFGEFARLNFS